MPYMTVAGFPDNPVPPSPRTGEETAAWYAREKEREAQWMGNLIGLLVYTADVLKTQEDSAGEGLTDEFLGARWMEWMAVYNAIPAEARATIRATCAALGIVLPL